MTINTKLSLKRCWDMVNRIQNDDPDEVIRRCGIAEDWLRANEVLNNDQFDELMMTVSHLYREAQHQQKAAAGWYNY